MKEGKKDVRKERKEGKKSLQSAVSGLLRSLNQSCRLGLLSDKERTPWMTKRDAYLSLAVTVTRQGWAVRVGLGSNGGPRRWLRWLSFGPDADLAVLTERKEKKNKHTYMP